MFGLNMASDNITDSYAGSEWMHDIHIRMMWKEELVKRSGVWATTVVRLGGTYWLCPTCQGKFYIRNSSGPACCMECRGLGLIAKELRRL